jgi:GT2 family glycosyltransferase
VGLTDPVALSISVVIVAYDSGAALERCLRSLRDGEPEAEVIVVDNAGSDRAVAEPFGIRLVEPGRNLGFAGGCNRGAAEANGEVLVFLNPDTVVDPGALSRLAETLQDPSIGIAMARLRLLARPELLNSGGNVVHLTGLAWAGSYEQPAESVSELRDVPYASGAALAIRTELFRELGGFTAELFMYQEDLELSWRARLYGLRVVIAPQADVYHDYEFGRNPAKHYLLERNRLIFVLTAYPGRLLVPVAPVLLAGELALTGLALGQGWLGPKAAGWGWLARHGRWLLRHRRETMRLKRVSTREVAQCLTPILDPKMIQLPPALGIANTLMSAYWRAARKLL